MQRREFLGILGGALALRPAAAEAQQPMPIIGFLDATSREKYDPYVGAFLSGLRGAGFVEGQGVAIDYRWAEGHYDRLPTLAAELARRPANVIVATGITAARAAATATQTIPIVFNTGGDPVKFGLVASFNKPGRNITGVASLGKTLVAKHLEFIHEIIPKSIAVAFVVNPNNAVAAYDTGEVENAAKALGKRLIIIKASTDSEVEAAFRTVVEQHAGALLMQLDPFFQSRQDQFVALAARHGVPTVSY